MGKAAGLEVMMEGSSSLALGARQNGAVPPFELFPLMMAPLLSRSNECDRDTLDPQAARRREDRVEIKTEKQKRRAERVCKTEATRERVEQMG